MKLKMITEVCKITGLTRKAILGYENEGLVKPTHVRDSGYREYDEEAIGMIIFVKMMMEAGYKRKDIKKILEDPSTNIIKVYEEVIEKLEKQKQYIEGMILIFKNQKWSTEQSQKTSFEYNSATFFKGPLGDNFIGRWKKSVELASRELSSNDNADYQRALELFGPPLNELMVLLFFSDEDPRSTHIQDALNNLYQKMIKELANFYTKEGWTYKEAYEMSKEDINELMIDRELYDSIKSYYGDAAVDRLKEAIKIFMNNHE